MESTGWGGCRKVYQWVTTRGGQERDILLSYGTVGDYRKLQELITYYFRKSEERILSAFVKKEEYMFEETVMFNLTSTLHNACLSGKVR